jgi:hypothetical protein
VYTPAEDFVGVDSFTYTVSDGKGGTATATVEVTITPVALVAAADDVSTPVDTAVVVDILVNDSTTSGNPLMVDSVAQPAHGQAVLNSDRTITYTPAGGFYGSDTFNYTISDGSGRTASAAVTISVVAPSTTVSFQQGVGGYTGTRDTRISRDQPTINWATIPTVYPRTDSEGDERDEVLLRFENIFGNGPGQIPPNAPIASATLELNITDAGYHVHLHRMLTSWADTANWQTFGAGIQADGVEAATTYDAATGLAGSVPTGPRTIDVAASLEAWRANPQANFGWVVLAIGRNELEFSSAEGVVPPKLTVTYFDTENQPFAAESGGSTPNSLALAALWGGLSSGRSENAVDAVHSEVEDDWYLAYFSDEQ